MSSRKREWKKGKWRAGGLWVGSWTQGMAKETGAARQERWRGVCGPCKAGWG